MSPILLTAVERRRLEAQVRSAREAGLYQRTLAVLEVASGQPVARVARLLRVSRRSVHNWLDAYRAGHDPQALQDHRGGGGARALTEASQDLLLAALEDSPQDWGYPAADWTVPLLCEHLARRGGGRVSDDTLRRQLHAWGYVWKRTRYELPADPEREKKNGRSAGGCGNCPRIASGCARTRPTCGCCRRCAPPGPSGASRPRC